MMGSATLTRPLAPAWLGNAPIDLIIAFGWLPFYLWLRTTPVAGDIGDPAFVPALRVAVVLALAINFVHRHFVYLLVFGDPQQRARHPRALWLAPLMVAVLVVPARLWSAPAFAVVLAVLTGWNIWHTLAQRHGIARAYAARAGGGLETRAHSRRDWRMLWAFAAVTAAATIVFRQDTFFGKAARTLGAVPILTTHAEVAWTLLALASGLVIVWTTAWVRAEAQASPAGSRAPRLIFWASTLCLFGVFVLHGPIVGYLVFGVAHSIEYILFVHVHAQRRLAHGEHSMSARVFGTPLALALLGAGLLAGFGLARQVWALPLFVAFYATTSALHYFYDGLIWKARRPTPQ